MDGAELLAAYTASPPEAQAALDRAIACRRMEHARRAFASVTQRVAVRNNILRGLIVSGMSATGAAAWRKLLAEVRLRDGRLLLRADLPDDIPYDLASVDQVRALEIGWRALRKAFENDTPTCSVDDLPQSHGNKPSHVCRAVRRRDTMSA